MIIIVIIISLVCLNRFGSSKTILQNLYRKLKKISSNNLKI